jgi:hypothetical protein
LEAVLSLKTSVDFTTLDDAESHKTVLFCSESSFSKHELWGKSLVKMDQFRTLEVHFTAALYKNTHYVSFWNTVYKWKPGKVKTELYGRSAYQILVLSGMCSLFFPILLVYTSSLILCIYVD